jgi:myo-inositol-1(or 4)-monophosphatase
VTSSQPAEPETGTLPWPVSLPRQPARIAQGLADLAPLAAALIGLADRLPGKQSWAAGAPGRVAQLERELEGELVALLVGHFGPVTVLAEEHYSSFGRYAYTAPDGADGLWFAVDPLDGSKSYAAGKRTYAVSVAGCLGERAMFGIVYQPSSGRLYTATRDAGAYLNGRRLGAPLDPVPRWVALGNGVVTDPVANTVVQRLRRKSYRFEHMACTSLKFCWLADGALAGLVKQLVERDGVLRIWGMAAGQLIASEAGFDCVNLDQRPWRWGPGTVAAGDRQFLADLF